MVSHKDSDGTYMSAHRSFTFLSLFLFLFIISLYVSLFLEFYRSFSERFPKESEHNFELNGVYYLCLCLKIYSLLELETLPFLQLISVSCLLDS